jgi:hypothetical protein
VDVETAQSWPVKQGLPYETGKIDDKGEIGKIRCQVLEEEGV